MQAIVDTKVVNTIRTVLIDVLILTFIYFLPVIAHQTLIPIYWIDPMRFVLVFTLLFTNRFNSFLIAATVPVFSFIVTSHPVLNKALLISFEHIVNIALFYMIFKKSKNIFVSLVLSVSIAKIIYYIGKFLFLNTGLLKGELVSTPIIIHLSSIILLCGIVAIAAKYIKNNQLNKL